MNWPPILYLYEIDEIKMKMKEPISTLTNLAFVVAAIPMLISGTFIGIYASLCMVLLCLGSWRYHQTLTRLNQGFDEVSMYWAFSSLIAIQLSVFIAPILAFFIAFGLSTVLTLMWNKISTFTVVPILAISAIILHGITTGWISALIVLGVFLLAIASRFIGKLILKKNIGRSAVLIEDILHGCWHIIAAYAMYLLWLI